MSEEQQTETEAFLEEVNQSKLSKTEKVQKRLRHLTEKHGWKLNVPDDILPAEDRSNGGGLRCFRMIHIEDEKDRPRYRRCKHPTNKGSFYCKRHGGGNTANLVHGKNSTTANAYRGAFGKDLGGLFDAFLNDPTILDAKPQLSALNVAFQQYLTELNSTKKIKNGLKKLAKIKEMLNDKVYSPEERFFQIKQFCSYQQTLTDPEVLDRIMHMVETISKVIERIDRVQTKEGFNLTPDGFKILLRCLVDIIKEKVDDKVLLSIKEEMLVVSSQTGGNLSKHLEAKVIEMKPNA